jgi:hypothetical protein
MKKNLKERLINRDDANHLMSTLRAGSISDVKGA